MKRYLLDTSALLTLRDDEAGADVVADLLSQSAEAQCHGSYITFMELLCRVWKDEGELAGLLAFEQAQACPSPGSMKIPDCWCRPPPSRRPTTYR